MMDAVAHARGLTPSGHAQKVYLLRSTDEGNRRYRVDLTRVAAAKERDIVLQPGDTIIVSTSWSRRILDGILNGIGLRGLAPTF